MVSAYYQSFSSISDKLQSWVDTAIKLIPNLIAAIIILIVFYGIGWLIRRLVAKSLQRVTDNKAITSLLETIAGIVVVAVGVFYALTVLQLGGFVTTLLAGAGVLGLALGFAFQDTASNFISGIILSIRHPFGIGDIIESKDYYGYVHEINLRCTIIRTTQNQLVYIPNKDMLSEPFVNYSWDHHRRIDLSVGTSYGDNLDEVEEVAIKAIEDLVDYDDERPVQVIYTELSGSTINFDVRFWIDFSKQFDYKKPKSDAIKAINKRFHENDIDMPFPVTTLDFGIRDGEKLDETLNKVEWNSNGDGSSE